MTIHLISAFLASLSVTGLVGMWLVPRLQNLKASQVIREDGPVWHNKKQGTPTMGGIMFAAGIIISCLSVGFIQLRTGSLTQIYIVIFASLFGLIGLVDDLQKLKHNQNLGLKAMQKFLLQLLVTAFLLVLLWFYGYISTDIFVPFFNTYLQVPPVLYYIFAAFVIVGTVNGVNITDGADGLAAGVTIPIALCFTALSFYWGFAQGGIFSAALTGGLVAFLVYNFYPAKVFMGDLGAQFLGGAIAAMAFVMDMPLILLPLGFVYFIETMSDIIQVSYFKMSKGKRVFKMAPLHHHFEMSGWSEKKIFYVFSGVSLLFAIITFFGVMNRFPQGGAQLF